MATVSFCKVHSENSKRFFDICVIGIAANEFQQDGPKQKRFQLIHKTGETYHVEIILQSLKEHKYTKPFWNSDPDIEFHFHRSSSGNYNFSIFNLPLQEQELQQVGRLDLTFGKVYVKTRQKDSLPAKRIDKNLPKTVHDDLEKIGEKKSVHVEKRETMWTIREKKGIYVTRSPHRNCESCFNLGASNICAVHRIEVNDRNMCKRYYPYTVRLGGAFSPK